MTLHPRPDAYLGDELIRLLQARRLGHVPTGFATMAEVDQEIEWIDHELHERARLRTIVDAQTPPWLVPVLLGCIIVTALVLAVGLRWT